MKLSQKYSRIILLLIISFLSCVGEKNHTKALNIDLEEITIDEIHKMYAENSLSVEDLTNSYIDRIKNIDYSGPKLQSVIMLNPDAISIAKELDRELAEGKWRGPLHGIPVLLKDNIDVKGKMPTTAGSNAMKNSFPQHDSFVAQQLRASGAIILGKTNMSEWANFRGKLSTSGWSALGGQTKNPYVLDRSPCGSSSGSGSAVSANLTVIAIGTETNGSIVCPSHVNGIVGIKPTVGLISRDGIIPISFTQDTPGPMARTVKDAAICLGVLVGEDAADVKTLKSKGNYHTDYTKFLDKNGLNGKKIGYYNAFEGMHVKVDSVMKTALDLIKSAGAEIVEINQINPPGTDNHSFEVMLFEYKDGLNNYFNSLGENAPIKNLSELIEFNNKDSLELKFFGQEYLLIANDKGGLGSEQYIKSLQHLEENSKKNGLDKILEIHNLDAIVAPTGIPAWKIDHVNGDFYMFGSSSPAAWAGYPSITLPMGFIQELPVGISFIGGAWSEPILISLAYSFEQLTHHRIVPKFLPTD